MGFVHQKEDAEDITQEVFIKAYQSLAGFAGQSSFSTWLYRIAIHTSLNALQKKKRRNIWDRVTDLLQLPSAARNPEQLLQDKSEQEKIRVAIDTLPEKQRMAFILSKYEELTQREIARIMEISDGAVEQLLIRARENLRKKLTTP
jgi:RNA polymerase sigma-70 factor (ECF subfamily)